MLEIAGHTCCAMMIWSRLRATILRCRTGSLRRIAKSEAGTDGLPNFLTRAVGVEEVQVDVSEELVLHNDTVLLCSDWLTSELSDLRGC